MTTPRTGPAPDATVFCPARADATERAALSDGQRFSANRIRGRFNAVFVSLMGGYINAHLHKQKARVFADLPPSVVELGSGVGANLRYLPAGAHLTAIEPNPYMHARLRRATRRQGVELEIRSVVGERIDLPNTSADAFISSLVLCTAICPKWSTGWNASISA